MTVSGAGREAATQASLPAGPLPNDPRAILLASLLDGSWPAPPALCATCLGRGWVEQADPFLGGHLDTRCPDCDIR